MVFNIKYAVSPHIISVLKAEWSFLVQQSTEHKVCRHGIISTSVKFNVNVSDNLEKEWDEHCSMGLASLIGCMKQASKTHWKDQCYPKGFCSPTVNEFCRIALFNSYTALWPLWAYWGHWQWNWEGPFEHELASSGLQAWTVTHNPLKEFCFGSKSLCYQQAVQKTSPCGWGSYAVSELLGGCHHKSIFWLLLL